MDFRKLLNPSYVVRGIQNRFWFWVARRLQFYLAHTHLVWGDESRVSIGRDVVLADTILNCRSGRITVEDEVFFGHHVLVLAGWHDYHLKGKARLLTVPQFGSDVIIRRGVWVASHVTILGPCEIGEDAVIASGSVVSGNVPAGMMYGGVPARPIKRIEFRRAPGGDTIPRERDSGAM